MMNLAAAKQLIADFDKGSASTVRTGNANGRNLRRATDRTFCCFEVEEARRVIHEAEPQPAPMSAEEFATWFVFASPAV